MTVLIVAVDGKAYHSWEDYLEDKANDGWITWAGGIQPVSDDTRVEVKFRYELGFARSAKEFRWSHRGIGTDIVEYRVLPRIDTVQVENENTEREQSYSTPVHNKYLRPFPYDNIDIYRVLQAYKVTDPCIQHAVKKLLCAGQRGYKEVEKDVQEAIQSLQRWEEMRREEVGDR